MAISYSLHLSAKSHAVTSKAKVGQVSKHNLREYKSDDYDKNLIEVLVGSQTSILKDMQDAYHREFDEAVAKYNEGKREDRKIRDYFQKVSDSRSDVGAEIIIQLGDMEFWKDKSLEDKKLMSHVFKDQLKGLEELCPEFKIVSAVVHYDESSPHMHVVGIPVATGYKNGMEKQVAKTKVFTKETLSNLQEKMHIRAEKGMELTREFNPQLFEDVKVKEKEKGRNYDIPKTAMTAYTDVLNETRLLSTQKKKTKDEIQELIEEKNGLEEFIGSLKKLRDSILRLVQNVKESAGVQGPIQRFRELIEKKKIIFVDDYENDKMIELKFTKLKSGKDAFIPTTRKGHLLQWKIGAETGSPLYVKELMKIYEPYGIVKTDGTVVMGKLDELKEANRVILPEETEELFDDMNLSEELAERVNSYKDTIKQIDHVEELERKRKEKYDREL